MIKRTITTPATYEEIEREAIQNEPPAIDTEAMAAENGEDWKNCEAYKNFRRESVLPFCVFYDGSKYLKSGHYDIDRLGEKDENGLSAIQRFYRQYPLGQILVYDPSAPFGYTQYELI